MATTTKKKTTTTKKEPIVGNEYKDKGVYVGNGMYVSK